MAEGQASFGALLREYRDRAGLTQEALAERAGLSPDAIGLLERGERRHPQRHTVRQLAAALGLGAAERVSFDGAARQDPPHQPPPHDATLPVPPTSFVGRADELTALVALLTAGDTRLVTLTGPGGVGKTRLALAVAARLRGHFADGIAFLPLATLREAALFPPELARAVGAGGRAGGDALASAIGRLRSRRLLLVLDNLEHLPEITPAIAALLAACPGVMLLATSRTPLHLGGEQQFPVPPLPLPPADGRLPAAAQAQHPAVQLFAQRARAVAPGFALTAENTATVVAICRHLDALPLAIELAAAWLKVLPPEALLARMERRLALLIGGPRDLPARHQSLRDTIAWSAALLLPQERALLRRLAVFNGGGTLAARAAVCAASALPDDALLPALGALVDASLLWPTATDAGAAPRFALLETVREYAAERLAAHDEAATFARRHAAYYLGLVEEAGARLVGPGEADWLARLDAESPNLRAALRWALDRGEADMAVRFAAVLWRFWAARGHLSEGRRWLAAILALAAPGGPIGPLRRAMLLHVTANLARTQGDYAHAATLYAECLAIRRAHNDPHGILSALHNLGITAHEQGDHARAIRLHEEALPLARAEGDGYGSAFVLTTLGEAVQADGDLDRALALYDEGLAAFRRLGHTWGVALALTRLGDATLARGDRARAATLQRESLARSGELGDPGSATDAIEGLARAEATHDPALTLRLLGAAATLRERLGIPATAARQSLTAQATASARARLDDEASATAWTAGAALQFEELLAELRSDKDDYRQEGRRRDGPPPPRYPSYKRTPLYEIGQLADSCAASCRHNRAMMRAPRRRMRHPRWPRATTAREGP